MRREQRRDLIQQARQRPAPLTLMGASLVSAGAAIAGLDVWVAAAAAVAAVLSGAHVVQTDLVVPLRSKSSMRAAVPILIHHRSGEAVFSTAVQYQPRRWLTAAHLVASAKTTQLRLAEDWVDANVIHEDDETGLAVLECSQDHAWLTRLAFDVPDEGAAVKVIGWLLREEPGGPRRTLRIALDYTLQTETETGDLVLTGPNPQWGFSGAPAIDVATGRTLGVLTGFYAAAAQADQPAPVQEVYIASAGRLPEHLRKEGSARWPLRTSSANDAPGRMPPKRASRHRGA